MKTKTIDYIRFWYSDGFAGRSYTLEVNGSFYNICNNLGDDSEARRLCLELLNKLGFSNYKIEGIIFKWDGTL